jgi:large repetitive protein
MLRNLLVTTTSLGMVLTTANCGDNRNLPDSRVRPPRMDAKPVDAKPIDAPAATGHLVINEIDYDQAGTDSKSFVEIFNGTGADVPLANFSVVTIKTDNSEGTRFALSTGGATLPAGGYIVVRNAAVTVPNGVLTVAATGDFLANAKFGVALINSSSNTLVDALCYEGSITAAVITGFAAPVSLVEGTATAIKDTNDDVNALARAINGKDTDVASTDWKLSAPSPGAVNP